MANKSGMMLHFQTRRFFLRTLLLGAAAAALGASPAQARENWVVYSLDESNQPLGWVDSNRIEQIQLDVWRCWCKQPSGDKVEFEIDGPLKKSRVLKVIADSGEESQPPREWITFGRHTKMYDLLQMLRKMPMSRNKNF